MTATLVSTPPAATAEQRRNDILDSVNFLIEVFERWQNDPSSPNVPTEQFEKALLNAAEVCDNGDTPAPCRELCMVAMPRLKEEWDQYVEGNRRRNGTPLPRFWAAFEAVAKARQAAKPHKIVIPPPVKQLLDVEKVSPEQIAWHIYGNNKKGPFVRENGSVDYLLLRKEADQPGSVIPDGWIPPWEQERYEEWMKCTTRLIASSDSLKEDQPDYVDPTPIEDMLRQGQMPAAIARVKRIAVDDVIRAANELGIPVPGMPATPATPPVVNPVAGPSATETDQQSAMSAILSDENPVTQDSATPAGTATVKQSKVTEITPELRDKIISLASNNNGVAEIAKILRDEGIAITQKQVQEAINKAG